MNLYAYVSDNPVAYSDPLGTIINIRTTPNNQSDLPNNDVLLGLVCMSKCLRTTIQVKFAGTQIFVPNTGQNLSCIAPGVPTPPYSGVVNQRPATPSSLSISAFCT